MKIVFSSTDNFYIFKRNNTTNRSHHSWIMLQSYRLAVMWRGTDVKHKFRLWLFIPWWLKHNEFLYLCCEQIHLLLFSCITDKTATQRELAVVFNPNCCNHSYHWINQDWYVMNYNLLISSYLPMHRNGEDGLDVCQHCFELLWILLEAHFCQYQRLANILDWKQNKILSLSFHQCQLVYYYTEK